MNHVNSKTNYIHLPREQRQYYIICFPTQIRSYECSQVFKRNLGPKSWSYKVSDRRAEPCVHIGKQIWFNRLFLIVCSLLIIHSSLSFNSPYQIFSIHHQLWRLADICLPSPFWHKAISHLEVFHGKMTYPKYCQLSKWYRVSNLEELILRHGCIFFPCFKDKAWNKAGGIEEVY